MPTRWWFEQLERAALKAENERLRLRVEQLQRALIHGRGR